MKKFLIGILIGGVVFGSIGAYAAYVYTANDIGYQPTDTEWNVNNVGQAINDIKTDINNINDLVDQGDMLYPEGTSIVGLVSDDTPYKDSNDKYILADSTTGKNMIDNVTYKAVSSTETLKGKVGADTANPFSGEDIYVEDFNYTSNSTKVFNLSFEPDIVILRGKEPSNCNRILVYEKDKSTNKWINAASSNGFSYGTDYLSFSNNYKTVTYADRYVSGDCRFIALKKPNS